MLVRVHAHTHAHDHTNRCGAEWTELMREKGGSWLQRRCLSLRNGSSRRSLYCRDGDDWVVFGDAYIAEVVVTL